MRSRRSTVSGPRARARPPAWLVLLACLHGAMAGAPGLTPKLLTWVAERYGEPARDRVRSWAALIESGRDLDEARKLEEVNRFFNRLRFVSDEEHWGRRDYWATPIEMLGTRGGDCEDFSIAKYFTLREMGVSDDRLRITYVKALELRQAHMVLAYYPTPGADPLILDNLVDEIRPGSRRRDLMPVYSFNGEGLWKARERGQGRRVGSARRLTLWRDLTARMNREHEVAEAQVAERPGAPLGTLVRAARAEPAPSRDRAGER